MFDFTIANPPSPALFDSPTPSQLFKDNYQQHESQVLSVYAEQGVELTVWSQATESERINFVYSA